MTATAQTIASPATLADLVGRLNRLHPEARRRWGTLTAGEMLCHLGDAHESALGTRVPPGPTPAPASRPLVKWLFLYSVLPWPRGIRTRAGVDPRLGGTKPGTFEQDRLRAVGSLKRLAAAPDTGLARDHFVFGPMSAADWRRWAFRHVDHHLRQFGL